ncbi:hypothetical protein APY03_4757 [Variovorax sp. WDL1]|nr:hypothetical protein APY03_4757 [Variovorax sp. WDL1]
MEEFFEVGEQGRRSPGRRHCSGAHADVLGKGFAGHPREGCASSSAKP